MTTTIAFIASGAGPFLMRPRAIEFLTIGLGLLLLVRLLHLVLKHHRDGIKWVVVGGLAYWLLAAVCLFALDTVVESGIFLALVVVNLAILVSGRQWSHPRIILLDVVLCFCLSQIAVPGRWVGFSYNSTYGYSLDRNALTRDGSAVLLNMVTLVILLTAYWVVERRHSNQASHAPSEPVQGAASSAHGG